ncbi:Inactive tyrosine-protein kinase transmembrane receptor ror1 [Cichlidogyrus casuarinus]|uniref:Inactive tyrosine-protein kinase transmembrane receptor ror1 n=1 Tax=Cichlidogyrus casuarinus TaxID=1844966 RepID=A0ABD2Q5C3_9PLAT
MLICGFRFSDQVGSGSFGPLYQAELVSNGTYENGSSGSLFVKSLSSVLGPSAQAEFVREANLLVELRHVNVLPLLGAVTKTPAWCLLFDITGLADLKVFLMSNRGALDHASLSEAQIVHLSTQIVSGMDYLHQKNFIHQDLAARNILIDDHLTAKISNLAFGKNCYQSDYISVPNCSGHLIPLRWMSPEALSQGSRTAEGDVFSFGVLLWEIWTGGMRPYSAYSDTEALDLITAKQACLVNPGGMCPAKMYQLMTDCWATVPSARPSFKDLQNYLNRWDNYATIPTDDMYISPAGTYANETLGGGAYTANSASHSAGSGKTNSTDMSERISSVPLPPGILPSYYKDDLKATTAGFVSPNPHTQAVFPTANYLQTNDPSHLIRSAVMIQHQGVR